MIPATLAERCHDLFKLALDAATKAEPVYVPIADKTDRCANHPNDKEPRDNAMRAEFVRMGDDEGQGLSPFWKWGFAAGWNARGRAAQQPTGAADLAEDQRAAVEFYTLNPSAALLDLHRRIGRPDQTAEIEAERNELAARIEEIEQAPWPEWATRCLKMIRQVSGYDGYDDQSQGVDLPEELGELIAQFNRLGDDFKRCAAERDRALAEIARQKLALEKIAGLSKEHPKDPIACANHAHSTAVLAIAPTANKEVTT